MYHYGGNNPVRYVDPDGREIHKLTEEQWEVVDKTLTNLSANLGSIIDELDASFGDIKKLNPEIINSARTFLTSEFGSLPLDISFLSSKLKDLKSHIDKLDYNDFHYDDNTSSYAYTYFISNDIWLGDIFFRAPDTGGFDTKEGTILHEATHFFMTLWTTDFTYEYKKMVALPDNGLFKNKQMNANNWEYFYEKIID